MRAGFMPALAVAKGANMGFTTFRLMRERAALAKRNEAKAQNKTEPLKESKTVKTDAVKADTVKTEPVRTETAKEQPKEAANPAVKSTQAKKRG